MPRKHFNGKLLGYKVTYHPVGLEKNSSFVTLNYKNTTELANLTAFTAYIIYVSAVSSGGVGPGTSTKAWTEERTDDAGT